MRQSDVYKINVPELGDRSDITVVSDAILAGEKNTIGNVQWMKATNSGNIITLTSETRTAKMSKYYNGLAVQFVSPINITSSSGAQIKIDNLNAQPFTTTNDIEVGNVVCAVYNASGFTASKMGVAVIDNLTTADSKKALSANQGKVLNEKKVDKTIQVIAGNGLVGGGALSNNVTVSVTNADDSIVVGTDNIKVNTYNALDSSSTTRPLSANQGRILSQKTDDAVATVVNKLDKGSVPEKYNTAEKIGSKIDDINKNGYKGFNNGSFRHETMNLDLIKKSGFWFMANMTENNDAPTEGGFYGIDSHYTQGHGSLQILADITEVPNLYVRTSPVTFNDRPGKYGKWEYIITSNNKLFTGVLGTDSIEYIQDGGTKILNNCYVDKVTGKPYRYLGGEPSNQVNSNFISLDLLSNSLPKFKKIFAQRIKQGQTYNIEDIRKFRALYFRNRAKNIGSILFNDEYLEDITDNKAPFSVYTIGADGSGFSNITGAFISYTQFNIVNAQTSSTALGYWNYIEIIGVY